MDRNQKIIRTSVLGIAANILLAAFKAVVGLLSHSVAIVLDAVNNLSDALSSLITIVGTKLASRNPDRKHPLGHGRVEYLSATIIAVIILYAGITSLVESIKKIITPETPDYSPAALIIIAAAVVVKILLGRYVGKVGREVSSESLEGSGKDALFDAVISASTLLAAALFLIFGWQLEAWLGAVISLVIIKSGIEMLRDTVSEILGERVDSETSKAVKETVSSFPEVFGAYDLILHSYGPDLLVGSVHIEVPDTMTVHELDELERKISKKVFKENHVALTGISVYSMNTRDEHVAAIQKKVMEIVTSYPEVLQIHGFYVDEGDRAIRFDIIIDFAARDRKALFGEIRERVQEAFPEYSIEMTLDYDVSD